MPSYLQKGPTLSLPANKTTQTNVAFGLGNGSDVNFTVTPPTGFSYVYVNTIYRTDWQGKVALSASARTNSATHSEPLLDQIPVKSATVTQGNITDNGLSNGITFPAVAQEDYAYKAVTVTSGQKIAASFFVRMADGGAPVVGTSTSGDLIITVGTKAQSPALSSVDSLGDGLYKIRFYRESLESVTGTYFGVARYAAQSGRGFTVTGYHIEINSSGGEVGAYIHTTTAPVTVTDYTVSGLTYTLAETPLTGAILSYTGYSYTSAYATFDVPTCGSISISPSGITSGKLRITVSVDGTNFNPSVILPIDEATGALAASSDLPNGFYTLNVKPFKSVRFTQTDVTDTVTILTALGR